MGEKMTRGLWMIFCFIGLLSQWFFGLVGFWFVDLISLMIFVSFLMFIISFLWC
jgi:hypothetical protein